MYDPDRGSPKGWLFGFARNLLKEHFKEEKRRLAAFSRAASRQVPPPEACDELVHNLDFKATAGQVAAALSTLSERDYTALTLDACAELSEAEIATALRIPRGTVKSTLNRARRRMLAQLDPRILETNDG